MEKYWINVIFFILLMPFRIFSYEENLDYHKNTDEQCKTKKRLPKYSKECTKFTVSRSTEVNNKPDPKRHKPTGRANGKHTTYSRTTSMITTFSRRTTPYGRETTTPKKETTIPLTTTPNQSLESKAFNHTGVFVTILVVLGLLLGVIFVLIVYKRQKCKKRRASRNHSSRQLCDPDPTLSDTGYTSLSMEENRHHYHEIVLPNTTNRNDNSQATDFAISNDRDLSQTFSKDTLSRDMNNETWFNRSPTKVNKTKVPNETADNYFILDSNERNYELAQRVSFTLGTPESIAEGAFAGNSNDYSILDPNETGFNQNNTNDWSTNYELAQRVSSTIGTPVNTSKGACAENSKDYSIFYPKETGFKMNNTIDRSTNNELAEPLSLTTTDTGQYNMTNMEKSDSATYFISQEEKTSNVYSHIRDTDYDTPLHRRKDDYDDEYDHVEGAIHKT